VTSTVPNYSKKSNGRFRVIFPTVEVRVNDIDNSNNKLHCQSIQRRLFELLVEFHSWEKERWWYYLIS